MNSPDYSPLGLPISPATQARAVDVLFADGCAAVDHINNSLTRAHTVTACLSRLADLRQADTNEIGGELALAVAGLVDQDIQVALVVLRGWLTDLSKTA